MEEEELLRKLRESIESRVKRLEEEHSSPVVELGDDFQEKISSNPVTVVLFTAPWCQPCKAFEPLYEIVARRMTSDERYRGRLVFAKLDTDAHPDIADKYNVDRIPTVIIYYKGGVADVIVGAVTEEELVRRIKEVVDKAE